MFQALDWLWLAVYTALTVALGAAFDLLGRRSSDDYFIAGRKLRAQSLAFERREAREKRAVEERNRWEG